MAASIKIKNCYPGGPIDIRLFNGNDTVRMIAASSTPGVAYQQSRISTCGTDTCLATVDYVVDNSGQTGGLAATYGSGMASSAAFTHELDETKTYCFAVLESGLARLGWSSHCC